MTLHDEEDEDDGNAQVPDKPLLAEDDDSSEEDEAPAAGQNRHLQRLRVKLPSGAPQQGSCRSRPAKLRLKMPVAASRAAEEPSGTGRLDDVPDPAAPAPKLGLRLKLPGGTVAGSRAGQAAGPPPMERQNTLKLRLRFSESGAIPQVDGAGDAEPEEDEQVMSEEGAPEKSKIELNELAHPDGDATATAMQSTDLADDWQRLNKEASQQQPAQPNAEPQGQPVSVQAPLADAAATPAGRSLAEDVVGNERESAALQEDAMRVESAPHEGEAAGPRMSPAAAEHVSEEGAAMQLGMEIQTLQPGEEAAAQGRSMQDMQQMPSTEPLAGAHELQSVTVPHDAEAGNVSTSEREQILIDRRDERPLLESQKEGLPALVSALRAWLKKHGGIVPAHYASDPEVM